MSNPKISLQNIVDKISTLPTEELVELDNYVEFLRFKAQHAAEAEMPNGLRLLHLRGLLAEYEFSPEMLNEVRHDLWRKVQQIES